MATRTRIGTSGGSERAGSDDGYEREEDPGPDLTTLLTTEPDDPAWVDAAPFRAHLRHLMSAGGLDATEVAVVLGLPTHAVRHLLDGRAGRPTRKISNGTARRLLLVRPSEVRDLGWALTPADAARGALRRLLAAGWSGAEVADEVGFATDDLRRLASLERCNRLLAVRLVGLARRLPGTLDDQALVPVPVGVLDPVLVATAA